MSQLSNFAVNQGSNVETTTCSKFGDYSDEDDVQIVGSSSASSSGVLQRTITMNQPVVVTSLSSVTSKPVQVVAPTPHPVRNIQPRNQQLEPQQPQQATASANINILNLNYASSTLVQLPDGSLLLQPVTSTSANTPVVVQQATTTPSVSVSTGSTSNPSIQVLNFQHSRPTTNSTSTQQTTVISPDLVQNLMTLLPGVKNISVNEDSTRIVIITRQDRVISMMAKDFNAFYALTQKVDQLQKQENRSPQLEEQLRQLRLMQNQVIKRANEEHQALENQKKQETSSGQLVLQAPRPGESKALVEYRVEGQRRYQLRLTPSQKQQVDEAIMKANSLQERVDLFEGLMKPTPQESFQPVIVPVQPQQIQYKPQTVALTPSSTMSVLSQSPVVRTMQPPRLPTVQIKPQQSAQQQPRVLTVKTSAHTPIQQLTPSQIRAAEIKRQLLSDHRLLLNIVKPEPFHSHDDAIVQLLRYHVLQDQFDTSEDLKHADKILNNVFQSLDDRKTRLKDAILGLDVRTHLLDELSSEHRYLCASKELEVERAFFEHEKITSRQSDIPCNSKDTWNLVLCPEVDNSSSVDQMMESNGTITSPQLVSSICSSPKRQRIDELDEASAAIASIL